MFSSSRDSDRRSVTSSNSVDQEFRLVVLVARDHAVGGEHALLVAPLDEVFAAVMTFRRLQRRCIRRLDALGGFRPEDLVGALADDVIAGEAREALERAVGENIAAVLDVLGGDADRNVVEHRFQELGGRCQFARQLALLGAILMRADRPAIGQAENLRQTTDRPSGSSVTTPSGRRASWRELLDGEAEQAPRAAQFEQFAAGHGARNIGAAEPVHFEKAVVAEDHAVLRVGHHHALVERVERRADEGAAPQLRALGAAQRRQHPDPDRDQKGNHGDAAEQELPDQVGIEFADIARRSKAAEGAAAHANPHGAAMASRQTRACAGIEFFRPACQFLSAITHPRFAGGVSGLTGLDRVNDYPCNSKM